MEIKDVWVVGNDVVYDEDHTWEIQGIYSSEALAVQNCKLGWWVGSIPLNTPLPDETTRWDVYYPECD
ncbi:hypothetical protein [Alishewanella phage vB_AspM_Slicko01]|nr:hypothetical protein [Alishewanella phage vB_AspM_Slicko01]